ncbi:MAG: type II secretion system protein GspL [Pseudomonadota bacterium]
MKQLLLLTGQTPDDSVLWWKGDGQGPADSGTAMGLSRLPDSLLEAEYISVVLPGERAATRRLILPLRRDAALEAAAELAFEDVLAEPTDEFHFAFGQADDEGRRRVSAVPTAWLEEWLQALGGAGIEADLVTLDHLALAADGQESILMRDGHRAVIRLPKGGMTIASEFAGKLVPRIDGASDAMRISVGLGLADDTTLVLADGRAQGAFYAAAVEREAPPNLLRGTFRRRRDWAGMVRQWQNVGGLAAACMLLWFGGTLADGMRHGAAAKDIRDEATEMFTAAFPGTPVRDLQRQAAARARVGGAPMFLPLSTALTAAMEDTLSIELTALRYEAGEGLIADLRFPEAASIEALRTRLEESGVVTQEGGNIRREDDGRYAGQLLLGGFQ